MRYVDERVLSEAVVVVVWVWLRRVYLGHLGPKRIVHVHIALKLVVDFCPTA